MSVEEELDKDIEEFMKRKDIIQGNINKENYFNDKVKKECLEFIMLQNDLILELLAYQLGRRQAENEK